jgi:hypothetical protein
MDQDEQSYRRPTQPFHFVSQAVGKGRPCMRPWVGPLVVILLPGPLILDGFETSVPRSVAFNAQMKQ